jgi:hypothetical protein
MPLYRLIFPPPPGSSFEESPTEVIDSGDVVYKVGDTIRRHGTLWMVSEAPLETVDQERFDEPADLMVWPAGGD